MSDRIAVMADGKVQQVGTPRDIYERPVARFVADFIGWTNLLSAVVVSSVSDECVLTVSGETVSLSGHAPSTYRAGDKVTLVVRPEHVTLSRAQGVVSPRWSGVVDTRQFLGESVGVRRAPRRRIHAPAGPDRRDGRVRARRRRMRRAAVEGALPHPGRHRGEPMSREPHELRKQLGSGLLSFPITPFTADMALDVDAVAAHVGRLSEHPFAGLFAAGGTGEFFSLTGGEVDTVVRTAVDVQDAVPVVAPAGYGTAMAVEMTTMRRGTARTASSCSRPT